MAARSQCPHCSCAFQVKDDLFGKRVRCPKCKQGIQIANTQPAGQSTIAAAPIRTATKPAHTKPAHTKTAAAKTAPTETTPKPIANPNPKTAAPIKNAKAKTAQTGKSQTQRAQPQKAAPKPLTQQQRQQHLLAGITGPIDRVRVPISYQISVLIVSIAMIILPVIYLLLIVATGFGVFYHLTHNAGMLSLGRGRGKILVFMAFMAPVVAGATMILFMIKPLFARSSSSQNRRSLTSDGEPILFAFVAKLCETVGAPMPKRIDVDCDVNASAGFRRGWLSLLTGNDLVLTIGLPLVAGMNVRQLAGVLAHEFGHFSQGVGMRLSFVVRSINMWFTRVVYQRDSWDDAIASAAQGLDIRIAWVVYLAQLCVWLSRRILWCLMMIGHTVSGFLLRQMEFDADRYETRFSGSAAFESTCRRLGEVGAAYQLGMTSLQRYYQEGQLTDNFPTLIQYNLDELSPEIREQLAKSLDEGKSGWFDTHPADKDRIASAHREKSQGVFRLEAPASALFCHYEKLCQNVTWDFYRRALGNEVKQSELKPIAGLLAKQKQEKESNESLKRFLMGTELRIDRSIVLPEAKFAAPTNPKAVLHSLRDARTDLAGAIEEYKTLATALEESTEQFLRAESSFALHRAKIVVPKDLDGGANEKKSKQNRESADIKRGRSGTKMEGFEKALGKRIVSAIELLYVPGVASRSLEARQFQQEVQRLLPVFRQMGMMIPLVAQLRDKYYIFSAMLGQIDRYSSHEPLIHRILDVDKEMCALLSRIQSASASAAYPFEHGKQGTMLAGYLLAAKPIVGNVSLTFDLSSEFFENFTVVYRRTLSRIAHIVEEVENALELT